MLFAINRVITVKPGPFLWTKIIKVIGESMEGHFRWLWYSWIMFVGAPFWTMSTGRSHHRHETWPLPNQYNLLVCACKYVRKVSGSERWLRFCSLFFSAPLVVTWKAMSDKAHWHHWLTLSFSNFDRIVRCPRFRVVSIFSSFSCVVITFSCYSCCLPKTLLCI